MLSFQHGCYAKVLKIPHLILVSLVKILQIKPVLRSEKAVSTAKVKGNRHHFHSYGTKHPSAPASKKASLKFGENETNTDYVSLGAL